MIDPATRPIEATRLFATDEVPRGAPAWFHEGRAELRRVFLDADDPYPCYFAESGERLATNHYTYLEPESDQGPIEAAALAPLAAALRTFLQRPRIRPAHRLSLLCLVRPPRMPISFAAHRARFWDVLGGLRVLDADPWPARTPTDPDDPGWNFCFAGEPLFTFGACPAYLPRRSRAVSRGLLLVFQPLTIFADIGGTTAAGRAAKRRIRDRLAVYDPVPMLADAGDGSGSTQAKWKQYFPPADGSPSAGRCPLAALIRRDSCEE
jgi:FPC/CPF motif-containing protein YcgG